MAAMLRTLIGLTILVLGVIAAAPFQRTSPPPPVSGIAADELVWRRPDLTLEIALEEDWEKVPATRHGLLSKAPEIRAERSGVEPSPTMAPAFQELPTPAPRQEDQAAFGGGARILGLSVSRRSPATTATADGPASSTGRDVASPPWELRHDIADGDDLKRLAQKYLGTENRWREIYEANRDTLDDPELLPIGLELRIPLTPPPTPAFPDA